MKIIKGFEGENLEVSDFGEQGGKDYIDYKFEYKNNQKLIKALFEQNQKYKEVIDKANEWVRDYMDEWDINDEVWQDLNDLLILLEEVE